MTNINFKGLFTAIITPFTEGRLDFLSLEKILEFQIESGVDGIVVAGSTGEGNSLTQEEYLALLQAAVDITKKRLPIIAGCVSSNTIFAKNLLSECQKIAIDGFMCTVPPYVKPSQEGLFQHFQILHDESELPIMLYSVPSRTGIDFDDETIIRLAQLPKIVALKDAGGDLERPLRIKNKLRGDFNLLSGNDELSLAYNAQGGVGCVSVVANIFPNLCMAMQEHWRKGNIKSAIKIHQQLLPLYKALFIEGNPAGVKCAAHYLGLSNGELRLPLVEVSDNTKAAIEEAILNVRSLV